MIEQEEGKIETTRILSIVFDRGSRGLEHQRRARGRFLDIEITKGNYGWGV